MGRSQGDSASTLGPDGAEPSQGSSPPLDFDALLESVRGIVWEADPKSFRFRYVSQQAERLLGYPRDWWLQEEDFFSRHLHPDDRAWVIDLCRTATAEGRSHEFEYRMVSAEGGTVWLRDLVTVVLEQGRLVSLRGVMVDITERKDAEEALRVREDQLQTVVRNAPVVLFALNREGVVTLCEGRGLEAAGIDPAQVVGRRARELWPGTPQVWENLGRGLAGDEFTDRVELEGRVFETRYLPVQDEHGQPNGLIGVATDLTERVRAERDHQRLEVQMQHAQKLESLGILAGGLAHDFNNVLMAVMGYADLMLADLPPLSQARAHAGRIRGAAQTASDLTNQLLAYAGQGALDVRPVDLSVVVEGMAELLRVSVSKRAVLRCELAEGLPMVEGDAAQLSQLILNLITNASESLRDGVGEIVLRTGVTHVDRAYLAQTFLQEDLAEGRYLYVEVSDTGAGMDEATRAKIFDPFFTTKLAGRGLGLATALGIVRGHRGAVSIYSEIGQGTLFRVLLPSCEGANEAAPTPLPPADRRFSGTVLVVDDEADVRELAGEMLRRLGVDVLTARNGREAVAIFREHGDRIGAVLLDATMPEMSSQEATGALHAVRAGAPIVLMSGYRKEYAMAQLAEGVVTGFLQKPFSREELTAVLAGVLSPAS